MKEVINYIKDLNISDEYVVAGISSGPDSMCLLDILIKLKINVVVAHINHNLREQSKEEESYLKEYCKKNNLIFEMKTIDSYGKENFHKEARDFRYNFYLDLCQKYNSKYILTAHHGDDLIETILMRLNRGTNFIGYAGIQRKRTEKGIIYVRPLLTKTKETIFKYLDDNNIKYYIDESNTSNKYTRNRIRQKVIPSLKEENENVHTKYLEFSKQIIKYDNFVNKCMLEKVKKVYEKNILYIDEYNKCDDLIKEKILEFILSELYGNDILCINNKHLELLKKAIDSSKPNMLLCFPRCLQVVKSYDKLKFEFEYQCNDIDYDYVFSDNLDIADKYILKKINSSEEKSNYCIRLSSSEIKLPLRVRSRRDGDKMILKNSRFHKKVKEIFIDSKIEASLRNSYPILTDSDNKILWIPGIKKSEYDKDSNEKYDLIIKYYKKEGKQ